MTYYKSMDAGFWTEERIIRYMKGYGDEFTYNAGYEDVVPLPDTISIFTYLREGDAVRVHPLLCEDNYDVVEDMMYYAGEWLTVDKVTYAFSEERKKHMEDPDSSFGPGPDVHLLDKDGEIIPFLWRNFHFSDVRLRNQTFLLPPNLPKKGVL